MGIKAIFGLTVVPAAMCGAILVACLSQRIRDLFFILLVFLSPIIERFDVNFWSREWYRGTARGFEVSVPDILALGLLGAAVLAPRRGEARAFWPASFGFQLLFFFYACAMVALQDPKLFGLFELFKMLHGLILVLAVAFYLRSERELRLLILSLGTLVCYEGLLALKQRYVDGIHRVPGTIDDSNSLSVFFCMTAPVMAAVINSRVPSILKYLSTAAIGLAVIGEVLTISRAGVIILASVLGATALATMSYRMTIRKFAITLMVISAGCGIAAKAWKTFQERFGESTLAQEYGNHRNLGRGYYLRVARAIIEDKWLGIGLNNWSFWVSNRYGPELGYRFVPYRGVDTEPSTVIPSGANVDEAQAAPAHCLGALTAGELGVPGLILFSLVWLRWLQMGASFLWPRTPDPLRRIAIGIFFGFVGVFLQSLTEWVFRQSPIYYLFHVLLGALAGLYYLKRRAKQAAQSETQSEESIFVPDESLAQPA